MTNKDLFRDYQLSQAIEFIKSVYPEELWDSKIKSLREIYERKLKNHERIRRN